MGAMSSAVLKNNQQVSTRGGARPGAGRKKGIPNKATAPIREAAREYTQQALTTLASVMGNEDQPAAARVAAANALLDRGYGKPSQPIDGDGEGGPVKHLHELSDAALAAIAAGGR